MNVPGRAEGNWSWRCTEDMLSDRPFEWLRDLTKNSNRSRRPSKISAIHSWKLQAGSRCQETERNFIRRMCALTPKRGDTMKATQLLHNLGQSIWLDNITRDLLNSGTLKRYIDELSVTGLTSNPTIFDHAIKNSTRLRRRDPREAEQGQIGRGALFRPGAGGHHPRRRAVSARPRSDRRRGRLGVARSVAAAGL